MATSRSEEVKGVSFEMIAAITSLSVVFSSIIGGAITIESRYAKSADVKTWVSDSYEKIVRLRILELELKGDKLLPHEQALLSHLKREIRQSHQ